MHIHQASGGALACVEVGGGSIQTVLFDNGNVDLLEGAHHPDGATLAFAVPGVVSNGLVQASNLDWRNVDPVAELSLRGPAALVLNDAEAAALGEMAVRGDVERLVYLGLGTGVGGAVVRDGKVVRANLFGHNATGFGTSFGNLPCRCGRRGCLETVAGGWALAESLSDADVKTVARLSAQAIADHELCGQGVVVIGGGIASRYPDIIGLVSSYLPSRIIEATRAPRAAKSAAAWGLRYLLDQESEE
jgi:predicted NBD/HSP70 family sugar kinase